MNNELIVVEKIDKDVIFIKEGVLDKVLEGIRKKLDKFEPDVSTAASRKEIASMSRKVSSSKTFLDQIRKDKIAKAKAEIDSANGVWKPAREKLDLWRDETRQPLTDWEEGIKATIDSWGKAFFGLNGIGTVNELNDIISKLEVIAITPDLYFEFTTDAFEKRDEILAAAKQALETRERLDREDAERKAEAVILEVQRKQQEEREAKLKADQEKIDAANKKIEEEKAELEAEKKAGQERRDREAFRTKAKQEAHEAAARKAEKDRKAKEAENIRIEQERVVKEEADELERKRQEALRPDKDQIYDYANDLVMLKQKPVDSDDAHNLFVWAHKQVVELSDLIKMKADDL